MKSRMKKQKRNIAMLGHKRIPSREGGVEMLCDEEEMVKSYRKSAADFVCRKYSWDDVVERTLELY